MDMNQSVCVAEVVTDEPLPSRGGLAFTGLLWEVPGTICGEDQYSVPLKASFCRMLSTVNVGATAIVNLKLTIVASLSPSSSTTNGVSKKQWPLIVQRSAKSWQRYLVSIPGDFSGCNG
jgi:hypothetical protein